MKSYRCITKCFYGNRLWCIGDIMDTDNKVESPFFKPLLAPVSNDDPDPNAGEIKPKKRKATAKDQDTSEIQE